MKKARIPRSEIDYYLTENLKSLVDAIEDYGFEVRVVGGAVRDLLNGKKPRDIDLSTNASPAELIYIFTENEFKYKTGGISHGTINVYFSEEEVYEVSSLGYRIESRNKKLHTTYDKDWAEDAAKRDFTVNALFMDWDGTVYDYYTGISDIKNQRIRMLGDPERLLKAFPRLLVRFFKVLTAFPQPVVSKRLLGAIKRHKMAIKDLPPEWVARMYAGIKSGKYPEKSLKLMDKLGIKSLIEAVAKAAPEEDESRWDQDLNNMRNAMRNMKGKRSSKSRKSINAYDDTMNDYSIMNAKKNAKDVYAKNAAKERRDEWHRKLAEEAFDKVMKRINAGDYLQISPSNNLFMVKEIQPAHSPQLLHLIIYRSAKGGSFKVFNTDIKITDYKKENSHYNIQPFDAVIIVALSKFSDVLNKVMPERTSFIHEYIHYLDYRRKAFAIKKRANPSSDFSRYINDPLELNAFYQEAASSIRKFIELTSKNKDRYSEASYMNDVNAFIKHFMRYPFFMKNFINYLTPENAKRIKKRLSNLYASLKSGSRLNAMISSYEGHEIDVNSGVDTNHTRNFWQTNAYWTSHAPFSNSNQGLDAKSL